MKIILIWLSINHLFIQSNQVDKRNVPSRKEKKITPL